MGVTHIEPKEGRTLLNRKEKKKILFTKKIMTGDRKWIFFTVQNLKKSWTRAEQHIQRQNEPLSVKIYTSLSGLDMKSMVSYERLELGVNVTAELYKQ